MNPQVDEYIGKAQKWQAEMGRLIGVLLAANLCDKGTMGVKVTALRRPGRAGHIPFQDDAPAFPFHQRDRDRHCREQRSRIEVERLRVELFLGGQLHDIAQVHDRDPIRDVPYYRQVVGDEQVGQVEPILQLLQEVDYLLLDRYIQSRDGLFGNNKVRPHRMRTILLF